MDKKKIILLIMVVLVTITISFTVVNALTLPSVSDSTESVYNISTDSNFFGETENTELVPIPEDYAAELQSKNYKLIAETNELMLYIYEKYFNIAVYDKTNGYIWYSVYPDYNTLGLSGTSLYFLNSGVTIEYYNKDNILVDSSKSYLSGSKYNVDVTYDYESLSDGVVAHLIYNDLGISFDVNVWLDGGKLVVNLPSDSIVEEDIESTTLSIVDGETVQTTKVTQYRLKAVYIFPYFGSNNYEINGYSMIPDGSGALIRYTNVRSSTAYIKRLYGTDEGITNFSTDSSTYYLQDELTASLPLFGVKHGYQQAAFLAVVTEGDAYAELNSYPYGYNSYYLNTTFFKFIVRERYTIQSSSSSDDSFQLINEDPYPTDYQIEYHFLEGEQASYSGMALKYRELLNLEQQNESIENLSVTYIGMDYKSGLFGKNFVVMTDYEDVATLTSELVSYGVTDMEVTYIGWSKGGYYDNTPVKAVVSLKMGGSSDFSSMMNTLESLGVSISFYNDPLISFSNALGTGVVKKITLSPFETDAVTSSLFDSTYFKDPLTISSTVLSQQKRYEKLSIDSLSLGTIGSNLYSYRSNSVNHYRQEVITTMQTELAALSDYNIALYQPNAYLWNYISTYNNAPIESNKYAYITDSIPFIELVLSGSVDMVSPYINYVSDYDLFALRLVEYGITPSFLITKESTHELRYTNFAYIYTSEYDLWRDIMVQMSLKVQTAFDAIGDASMTSHRYIQDGVAEVTYSNGVTIYINYSSEVRVITTGLAVAPSSYRVVTQND